MGNFHKNIQLMLEFPKTPLFVHWKNAGKNQLVSSDLSNNTGAINVKMGGSILEEKSSFKMVGLTFSSKLDWSCCIISIVKTTSKIIGTLIPSMKFLSPEVSLYLHKCTILPYMEYCCHVMAGARTSLLLEILREATKTDMQDCWSFTCCFSRILDLSSKCSQLKSFL